MRRFLGLVFLALGGAAAAHSEYHVISKIPVGGEGFWDYMTMDSAARRLYVSHATKVVVIDMDSQKIVGEIADTKGVHGIALAPELNRGFVSNGGSNNVTIFDLKTFKLIELVSTGQNPDAISYEPVSGRVVTFNGRSKDATFIDAKTAKVLGTIPMGGKPEFSAVDGKGKIYVNNEDKGEMSEVDAKTMTVTKTYPLTGCEEPSGLAMDTAHRRLFSVCGNKVMIVSDPDAGTVVATVPIGQGADGAGYDPGSGLAFSSNGEGTLTVVQNVSGKYEVKQTAQTQRGARTMAVDVKTHRVYMPTAQFGPAPAPTAETPRPRPTLIPDSFVVLVVGE